MQGGTTLACTCTHLAPTAPLTSLHPSTGPAWAPPRHRGLGCEAAAARQWWRGGEVARCAHCVVPLVHRSPPPADTDTGAAELVLPLLC